jgi:hypothetical protein
MASQSTLRRSADPLANLYHIYSSLVRERFKGASKTTKLIGTLFLAISIIAGGEGGRRWWKKSHAEKEQGRRLLRRNSGLKNKDGSRVVFVPYKDSTSKVTIHPTKALTSDTPTTNEARAQSGVPASISKFAQYNDPKMDQQGDGIAFESWSISDAANIPIFSCG